MSDDKSKQFSEKLDKIIRLLAVIALKDQQTEKAKITLLDSLGFTSVEISKALNKPPNYVGVYLGQLKKQRSKKQAEQANTSVPQESHDVHSSTSAQEQ